MGFIQDIVLVAAITTQFYGIYCYIKLGKKSGWMLPFILWNFIVVGMMVPRIMSELIQMGFLWQGLSRETYAYIFVVNSVLVVWSAKCFSKHIDQWLDNIQKLEAKALEASIVVTEVEVDQDADVRS